MGNPCVVQGTCWVGGVSLASYWNKRRLHTHSELGNLPWPFDELGLLYAAFVFEDGSALGIVTCDQATERRKGVFNAGGGDGRHGDWL